MVTTFRKNLNHTLHELGSWGGSILLSKSKQEKMDTKTNINNTSGNERKLVIREVKEHFAKVHKECADQFPGFTKFLESHLFFVTATFHPGAVSTFTRERVNPRLGQDYRSPGVFEEFGVFYFKVAKCAIGKNLQRKRRWQPLTYAFIDFEGAASDACVAAQQQLKPHVHALMLVRPQHITTYRNVAIVPDDFKAQTMDSLKMERFNPSENSLDQLITYCAKSYLATPVKEWRDPKYPGKLLVNDNRRDELKAVFPR